MKTRLFLLLLGTAALLLAPAGAAFAAGRVTLKPAAGGVETQVSLSGRGFGASRTVKVKAGRRILARTRTNAGGAFSVRFRVFQRARKPLRIVSISGRHRVASFFRTGVSETEPEATEIAFESGGRLRWAPSSGAAQSKVGLRGSGFRSRRPIRASFGGVSSRLGRTGRGGTFTKALVVPPLPRGSHRVRLRIGRTRLAFAFDVTADPLVAAVGDIACDPEDPAFNGGLGSADKCHMRQTSDVVAAGRPDSVLVLGDAQYEGATLADFRLSYDPTWGRFKSITRPAPGNHEYGASDAAGYFAYFGPAAGDPRKGYYSFNIGAWHIIALNSNCSELGINCAVGFAQEGWLRADLKAHRNRCVLAFWHHPLFSSGQHGNHPTVRAFYSALYENGADVVLVGHDHDYERFAPQAPDGTLDPVNGIREFVVGTGGRDLQSVRRQAKPNSEVRHDSTYGVLMLRLHPTSYEWEFVPEAGRSFRDAGTQNCH